jgi:hypothetical protein
VPVFGNVKLLETTLIKLFEILNPESDEILLLFPENLQQLYEEFRKLKGYGLLTSILTNANNLSSLINRGIEESKGNYLLILKEGLIPLKLNLEDAITKVDSNKNIILGSYVIDPDGKIIHAGASFDRNNTVFYPLKGESITSLTEIKEKESPLMDFLIFAKRETFQQLGKFDERLHDFYSILDYTLNAHLKGYKNLVSPFLYTGFLANHSFSPLDHRGHLQFYTKWRGLT